MESAQGCPRTFLFMIGAILIRHFQVRKGDHALSGEQAYTLTSSEFAVCHGRAAVRRPGIGGPTNCEPFLGPHSHARFVATLIREAGHHTCVTQRMSLSTAIHAHPPAFIFACQKGKNLARTAFRERSRKAWRLYQRRTQTGYSAD